jgi:hypothetical protein
MRLERNYLEKRQRKKATQQEVNMPSVTDTVSEYLFPYVAK